MELFFFQFIFNLYLLRQLIFNLTKTVSISIISTMAVLGMSICKPAENPGDKKGRAGRPYKPLKVQEQKGFCKPERKQTQHYVIIVFMLLLTLIFELC